MESRGYVLWGVGLLLLTLMEGSSATLSPSGINYEVVALMTIKNNLNDPYNVLENWDINSVDPCSWRMVTCSSDGYVSALGLPSQSLSGTLSPWIGNLTNLQSVWVKFCMLLALISNIVCGRDGFENNAISGPIPDSIGKLEKLETLDLSHNKFDGGIPSSLGGLKKLNYLRLNNNSLTGPCPESLSQVEGLSLVIIGNPSLCGANATNNCSAISPEPLSFPPDALRDSGSKSHRVAIAFGASFGAALLIIIIVGLSVWWRYRRNQQIFFDVNDQYDPEVRLGHLRRYTFKELRAATDHFNPKNILGRGGFGIVYKGCLNDRTLVAVKRLKDYNAVGGEIQFQTEVEMISLAVHRNLLRLCGFCTTESERLLVYPYMPNGSVASRLRVAALGKYRFQIIANSVSFTTAALATSAITIKPTFTTSSTFLIENACVTIDQIHGRPALDWSRRKRIALGTARGLLYLHEQCDPKIIHRDVKAANILLDEDFEAVVGDFGLAKLLDHRESHVTTAVRGTVGHIAPEYLSTGQSSEKTDVFGFGILLLELITGQKALDFGRAANQKGVMLDWVKKLHQEGKLNLMVDKDLKNNFDRVELEEMVKVALLCTQFNPSHRPKMSEILRMLEGDGLAEKWEASQKVETPRFRSCENPPQRYSDYIEESSLVIEAMELSGPRTDSAQLDLMDTNTFNKAQVLNHIPQTLILFCGICERLFCTYFFDAPIKESHGLIMGFPQIRPIGHKCVQPVPKKALFYLGSPLRLPTPNRLAQYDFPGEREKLI
ncbi:Protein NSP-interacting kinase 3 [Vitis vinifera]|uniref:non-specific serine/threonine protein kinase n=1 Tax=Vitis vinifera TaxID=29760 RepID=A0A438E686_VITVI|nr:Protein NSP-interacting kinase 3 [Vitis vinifera]